MNHAFNDDSFPSSCLALLTSPGSEQTMPAVLTTMTVGGYTNMLLTSAALLLTMTATTTLVRPAGASSSSSIETFPPIYSTVFSSFSSTVFSSSSFDEACAADINACVLDDTCYSCSSFNVVNVDDFNECVSDITVDNPDSFAAVCSVLLSAVCCFEKLSDNNCVNNDNFRDLWLCDLENQGCSFDSITCDSNSGAGGVSSGTLAAVGHASIAAVTCALFVQLFSLF